VSLPGVPACPSDDALALACHRLAGLLGCGAALAAALQSVADDAPGRRERAAWHELGERVAAGVPLSSALAAQPTVFGIDMVARVRAAEADGSLAAAFEDLERLAVQRGEHRARLRSALAYPLLAAVTLALATGFLLVRIVPLLVEGIGAGPPREPAWHALPLLHASWLLSQPGGMAAVLCIALAGATLLWYRARSGRGIGATGRIGAAFELARIAGTLSRLHAAGLPLDEALDIAAHGCAGSRRRDRLLSARRRLVSGASFSDALAGERAVPDLFVRFVAAGESAGTLDAALSRIAEHHEREARRRLARTEALSGPVVLALFGAVLLWVIVSVLLPVYEHALGAGS